MYLLRGTNYSYDYDYYHYLVSYIYVGLMTYSPFKYK